MAPFAFKPLCVAALAALVALSGCTGPRTPAPNISSADAAAEAEKQRELYAKRQLRDEARLWSISYPMRAEGAALCGEALRPGLGLRVMARQYLEGEGAATFARLLKLSDRPQVIQVAAGAPAEAAGIEVGDQLLEIGGEPVKSGRNLAALVGLLERNLQPGKAVTYKLRRGTETVYANPVPRRICAYDVFLIKGDQINAYADGENVFISRGMMRFAESDQHLAVVVGHELAHNAMEHIDAKQGNALAAGAGGLLLDIGLAVLGVNTQGAFAKAAAQAGAASYSVGFEQEADHVGLYFMARAGYELEGAADIWRLMAAENPRAIDHRRTHPTTPERFLALEQAIEEIKGKQAAGAALLPDLLPEPGGADENRLLESEYPQ